MNTKDKGETNDQAIVIEDLSAEKAEAVKGGPDRDKFEAENAYLCVYHPRKRNHKTVSNRS